MTDRILAFDIEANGLAEVNIVGQGQPDPEISRIHCIVAVDIKTKEVFKFRSHQVKEAWDFLNEAKALIAHNGLTYDILVLNRLVGSSFVDYKKMLDKTYDTLLMSRLMWPDRQKNPAGGYSLKAIGDYVGGQKKSDYSGDWEAFSQEMLDYCVQDVLTTIDIFNYLTRGLKDRGVSSNVIKMEHDFGRIIALQTERGWCFDIDSAEKVLFQILETKRSIEDQLRSVFPDTIKQMASVEYHVDPETNLKYSTKSEVKGKGSGAIRARLIAGPYKTKSIPFNPGSSLQITQRFGKKYDWVPDRNIETGKPICDVSVLESLDFPEAALLLKYREVDKLRGQIEDWIHRSGISRDGRIHGSLNTLGTVTGRTSAKQPNIQQVSGDSLARDLWIVPQDSFMVGCDLSGLELRCLAHYLYPFDEGVYANEILSGDIHKLNQNAAGLENRDQAKTFIYALIYGGGNAKIGEVVGGDDRQGANLKSKFFKRLPALKDLIENTKGEASLMGNITLIDGRPVPLRSEHKALSVLLQGCGAIVAKQWCIEAHKILDRDGASSKCFQIGFIHDEMQWECSDDSSATYLCKVLEQAAVNAGEYLNMSIPIEAEATIGRKWSECH